MTPETSDTLAWLEGSGLIAEALAAFRVDHVYAVQVANERARLERARTKQSLSPGASNAPANYGKAA